jgi:diguanylate cyclase (GGDEF)-like protein/PAS domain S-box-containing protein
MSYSVGRRLRHSVIIRSSMNKQRFHKPFMWLITTAGAAICIFSAYRLPLAQMDVRLMVLALLTLCFGSRIGIHVPELKVQVTVSDAFIFLTVLLYGGEIAILLAVLEAVCISSRVNKNLSTILFNGALLACSTFITVSSVSFCLSSVVHASPGEIPSHFRLVNYGMAAGQYVTNSGLAALRESLKLGRPFWQTWKEYLWTAVTYFTGASLAGISFLLMGSGSIYALLLTLPLISSIHFTFKAYHKNFKATAEQAAQAKLHVEELSRHIDIQDQIKDALQESEEHFRSAFDYAATGMAVVMTDGRFLQVNHSLCEILGYSEQGLLRMDFQSIIHPDDLGKHLADVYLLLEGESVTKSIEGRYVHKLGHEVWVLSNLSLVRDAQGKPLRVLIQVQDITERKRAEAQLHRAAFYDMRTGLPNRTLFTEHLQLAIERTTQHPEHLIAVLFLDVDRFKNVNDSLGHTIGDQLLSLIARRLKNCVRAEDTVARFGGDEFAILLNGITNSIDAVHVAKHVQQRLLQPFNLGGHEVFATASIGIALSSNEHNGPEDLLRDADIAMYRAKAQGNGHHEVFDKMMHARAVSRLQLENDLRRAIERQEFVIHYQPIIRLDTGRLSGFEALIRWQHPERGLIPPAEFIPIAEETEMIIPIGQWVLREACRQTRQWQAQFLGGEPLTISVNLSGKQFMQADLVEYIKHTLRETELEPSCLRLEITESVVMDRFEIAIDMLRQLRSINVQLSIDDFGTGYSSLSYLHRLPVNTLKIDRSFVSRMSEGNENAEIVRTIITLARNLKMDVVAEGVETGAQCAHLKTLTCEYGQGYLFSRPVEAEAATRLLHKNFFVDLTISPAIDETFSHDELDTLSSSLPM